MPNCGTQCFLCDIPIRFDTYEGCSHGCEYCFAKKFKDISKIKKGETIVSLKSFVEGKRNLETCWCDWNIPLHWGGMSDPFQPCEKIRKNSLECLKYLKEKQYPFVVSTKGKLVVEEPYLSLLSESNCVVQISAVCSSYDEIEEGCPSFKERMQMVKTLSKKVKRVIIRVQPYMHEVFDEVFNNIKLFKEVGAYGIIIEGMKYKNSKKDLVKVAGDFTYNYDLISDDFMKLKEEAHRVGLKIYAGENRIRKLGDSLTCCGIDGLEGFEPNKFNLNHLVNGDINEPTEKMKQLKTGQCFTSLTQDTANGTRLRNNSFAYNMIELYKNKKNYINEVFALTIKEKEKK